MNSLRTDPVRLDRKLVARYVKNGYLDSESMTDEDADIILQYALFGKVEYKN